MNTKQQTEARFYDLTIVTRQDLSINKVSKITDLVCDYLTNQGGTIIKKEYWGARDLGYLMNKNRRGHYFMISTSLPPHAITKIKHKMKYVNEILRHMFVMTTEELASKPSLIAVNSEINPTTSNAEHNSNSKRDKYNASGDKLSPEHTNHKQINQAE